VNDAPVALDDAYGGEEDTTLSVPAPGVLGNDADVDGDALTAALVSGPASGTLTLNADGSFEYVPDAGFNGVDSFTYTASDGTASSNVATVTITINAVNDAPVALDDAASTDFETAAIIAVLANDSDPDGDALAVVGVTDGANGSVVINADGTATYTPNAGFSGTDAFTYTISDPGGLTAAATVTVEVAAPPCGSIQSQVSDASSGDPIAGATVELLDSSAAVIASGTTDASGGYLFACVPAAEAGAFTLQASATGFSTGTVPVPDLAPSATITVTIALVPLSPCTGGENGPITIVLTWGAVPADLDSHLSGPDTAGGRFHVYYNNQNPVDYASLDVDDITSFGPETVTITIDPVGGAFVAGDYHYWVHDYTNRFGSAQFAVSGATVTVTQCGSQIAQYQVSAVTGDSTRHLWHVFNFTLSSDGDVTVTPIQTFKIGDQTTVL
jgi:VCBS repeat-containing protein